MYSELDTFYRHLLIQTVRKTRSLANRLNLTGVKGGLPHSEIHGSKLIRSSPWLIAAYHVLHRLCMPRHSPNALKSLDHSHRQCPPSRSRLNGTRRERRTFTMSSSNTANPGKVCNLVQDPAAVFYLSTGRLNPIDERPAS